MRLNRLILLIPLLALGGCRSGQLPNPNDPLDGPLSAENLRDQMGCISDAMLTREAKGQITDAQYHDILQDAANSLLRGFNPDKIDISKAWQIADVLITAKRWSQAKKVLVGAVEWAKVKKNEDRRVNDGLRLAQVLAEMGEVPEAIKTARAASETRPEDSVPILNATLLRIVPAGKGKGHDLELAKLLQDAIAIDNRAVVDPASGPGETYLRTRVFLQGKAWKLIGELDSGANRSDLAAQAQAKLREIEEKDPRFEERLLREQHRFRNL